MRERCPFYHSREEQEYCAVMDPDQLVGRYGAGCGGADQPCVFIMYRALAAYRSKHNETEKDDATIVEAAIAEFRAARAELLASDPTAMYPSKIEGILCSEHD